LQGTCKKIHFHGLLRQNALQIAYLPAKFADWGGGPGAGITRSRKLPLPVIQHGAVDAELFRER
jgi:hypothetical protein